MELIELMEIIDKIMERVQLLLGETYYVRYDYNTCDECLLIRVLRWDCNIHVKMQFYRQDLNIDFKILASFIAQRVISMVSDLIDKYEKEEE